MPVAGALYYVSLLIGILVSLVLYLLPTIIALARRVANLPMVVAVNVLLGCTGIGWVVALAMSVRTKTRPRA